MADSGYSNAHVTLGLERSPGDGCAQVHLQGQPLRDRGWAGCSDSMGTGPALGIP